jgi:hypothetical protein
VNDTFTAMRREDMPILTEVGDYAGQEAVKVSCTQLGTNHNAAEARRVVAGWTDFFSSGPSTIRDLEFVTRTPNGSSRPCRDRPNSGGWPPSVVTTRTCRRSVAFTSCVS